MISSTSKLIIMGVRDDKLDMAVQQYLHKEDRWINILYSEETGVRPAPESERLTHSQALARMNSIPGSQKAAIYRIFQAGEYAPQSGQAAR